MWPPYDLRCGTKIKTRTRRNTLDRSSSKVPNPLDLVGSSSSPGRIFAHAKECLFQTEGLALQVSDSRVDIFTASQISHVLERMRCSNSTAGAEVSTSTLEPVCCALESGEVPCRHTVPDLGEGSRYLAAEHPRELDHQTPIPFDAGQ